MRDGQEDEGGMNKQEKILHLSIFLVCCLHQHKCYSRRETSYIIIIKLNEGKEEEFIVFILSFTNGDGVLQRGRHESHDLTKST